MVEMENIVRGNIMRRAIIDNSTLTAIQRLLGEIPVYNKYTLDGDILAFETLIQTILFFDEIYYIDDYKREYRKRRSEYFTYIEGIKIDDSNYSKLLENTRYLTRDIIPTIEGGTFEDENFKPFFELLKMNNIFTWDLRSSVFYLTQKMLCGINNELDVDTYSELIQMIFSEGKDGFERENNPSRKIIDSNGNEISSQYNKLVKGDMVVSKQVDYFLSNLSWLAYRTIFYTLAVNEIGGSLVLHPIRDAFQISYLSRMNQEFNSTYRRLVHIMNRAAESRVRSIYESSNPMVSKYNLPLFSVAFIQKTSNPIGIIDYALHKREEGDFVLARKKLEEIEDLFAIGKNAKARTEANKLICEVETLMQKLGEKYYVSTPQGVQLSPLFQVYNMGVVLSGVEMPQVPEFTTPINIQNKVKEMVPQRGFNAVYKSVVNDLANIGKIGACYDKLTSKVIYDKEAKYYTAKTEEEKYKNYSCFWKRPM